MTTPSGPSRLMTAKIADAVLEGQAIRQSQEAELEKAEADELDEADKLDEADQAELEVVGAVTGPEGE